MACETVKGLKRRNKGESEGIKRKELINGKRMKTN
jgi:hypothetical protein